MDKEILKLLLREVVKKFPNTGAEYDFDAHDVIRKFISEYPDYYEMLLAEQRNMDAEHVIKQVHAFIGRTMNELNDVIQKVAFDDTLNYKGVMSKNSLWKRK